MEKENNRIQLPLEEIKLAFAASCVEGAARKLLIDKYLVYNGTEKKYKQINTKTPEIQEMILSYQIGGVAYELSKRLEISPALALDLFYRSKTCAQLHDKRTGLYLMSNGYIADDFIYEKQRGY